VSGYAADDISKYLTKRTVEIEWDEVPDATQYDLEIYDGKSKKFIKTFTSKTSVFKLNIKMGKYYFRSRIFDKFERSSDWTDMAELVIAPPPTKIKSKMPEAPEVFANKKTGLFDLPIVWEPLPGVESYKLLLETPEGKVEKEFVIKGTSAAVKVPPGQYQMRVQAVLSDGTVGDPSEATPILSVLGAKIQAPSLQFKRIPTKGQWVSFRSELASAHFDGELYYKPLEGTSWAKVREFKDMKDRKIVFDHTYTPGLYLLKMVAKAKGFTPSEHGETEFLLKPIEPDLLPIPEETISFLKGLDPKI
jgi:hypothetical protein